MNHKLTLVKQLTMTSREIATLTGKEHKNVKRDILLMLVEIELDPLNFERIYLDSLNREQTEYLLTRELTETLLTGYSAKLRLAVIKRWREMEDGETQVPKTLSSALRLAADQAEEIERQSEQLAIAAPKVQFVDTFVTTIGLKGFREVAKLLGANEARFKEFLLEQSIFYRLNGALTAYQQHIDAKRFEVKLGISDSNERSFTQTLFTPKGVNWIAGLWAVAQLSKNNNE